MMENAFNEGSWLMTTKLDDLAIGRKLFRIPSSIQSSDECIRIVVPWLGANKYFVVNRWMVQGYVVEVERFDDVGIPLSDPTRFARN